jgi:hypothetical protein
MASRLRQLAIVFSAGCLLTAGGAGAAGKAPKHLKKTATQSTQAHYTDSGPEPLLAKVFDAIEANRLDLAMQQTDALIKAYPNFRLAHLIRGDLLLARSRPLTSFGKAAALLRVTRWPTCVTRPSSASRATAPSRERTTFRATCCRCTPSKSMPLWWIPRSHASICIKTTRVRHASSPTTTSRKASSVPKSCREGDKKTPIGVYHVTSSLPRQKLTDFYGSGAFPINYPNEWDKRQGRNGHGIWLHGTPSDTFSRPPKASDGCVVLANQDLDALAKSLQIGLTPVIISNSIEWLSLDDWQTERSAVRSIEEWRSDWESRDTDAYAAPLFAKIQADGQGYRDWVEHKRKVNAGKQLDQGRRPTTSACSAIPARKNMSSSPSSRTIVPTTFPTR